MAQNTDDENEWLERKAIDTSGRLGSLYDALTDNIVYAQNLPAPAPRTLTPTKRSICRTFHGSSSKTFLDYLEYIEFDDAMKQSILFGMVKPQGISSLVDYNQSINENTRLLYYCYRSKEEELPLTSDIAPKAVSSSVSLSTRAPYIISKIVWGFEILCIIPITDNLRANELDRLLESITKQLEVNSKYLMLDDAQKEQINYIINVEIYGSQKCIEHSNKSFKTILAQLQHWQKDDSFHHPLRYSMYSLKPLLHNPKYTTLEKLSKDVTTGLDKFQHTLFWYKKWAEEFRKCFKNLPSNFPSVTLNGILQNIDETLQNWLMGYNEYQVDLRKIMVYTRENQSLPPNSANILSDPKYKMFKETNVQVFNAEIRKLFEKVQLMKKLDGDNIQYTNVQDICIEKKLPVTFENIDTSLKTWNFGENYRVIIWYSSDRLMEKQSNEWNTYYNEMLREKSQPGNTVLLVYADFSQCEQLLSNFQLIRLPLNSLPAATIVVKSQPPPSKKEINVLILGETGVGKSTFINAFVNYLVFDSLQQAEQSQPVLLIPVSFLMTQADHFQEVNVKFGNLDKNENFEHEGQSVTQQCKSYIFKLNDQTNLRLIDTPGINDTRGVDQDNKNMEHIFTYINNLSHLNAICLLLKPNNSKLTTFFRSCISQLFNYLTPISYGNVIFCFTNARSTFFTAGDSGPLIREMLKKEYHDAIPFTKENTFCFDSESFRYLAAKKCGVEFEEFYQKECIKSWDQSVIQSIRLLQYIKDLSSYNLNDWQSPRKAVLDIITLARPLMTLLRFILYNLILHEMKITNGRIEFKFFPLNADMCSNCILTCKQRKGPFYFIEYQRTSESQHSKCQSNLLMEYYTVHEFINQSQEHPDEKLNQLFRDFLDNCVKLSYFFQQQDSSTINDPFLLILDEFINEEQDISNTKLRDGLNRIKDRLLNKKTNGNCSLNEINTIINNLRAYDSIQKQLCSIIESRQSKMKANERLITLPENKNRRFILLQ